MNFTKDQHQIWATLFANQIGNVRHHACSEYLQGFELLQLTLDRIPNLKFLNSTITPHTGWKVVRTHIRYSDSLPWYLHFAKQEFLITNYLRSWEELDFTPEPDMFHDLFGHLPYLTLPQYTNLYDMFTAAFLRANPEEQDNIKRLAWFSYEFGLKRESGKIKLFGTGLISSRGESLNVTNHKVTIAPFTIENVLRKNKAIDSFNHKLFFFTNLNELKTELNKYFQNIKGPSTISTQHLHHIEDQEMDLLQYKV